MDALNQLAVTQHGNDTFVWQEWVVSGVNLLLEPLGEKCHVVSEEIERIDIFCGAIERQLTEMNTLAARKARRKRVEQGQVCQPDRIFFLIYQQDLWFLPSSISPHLMLFAQLEMATLEDEIREMEAKLERSRGYLESATKEDQMISAVTAAISENRSLTNNVREMETVAESMEQGYITQNGISRWEPSRLDEQELSFHYIGPCPKACIAVAFPMSNPSSVTCSATVQPKLFRGSGAQSSKFPLAVTGFLQRQATIICQSNNKIRLCSPKLIGQFLQQLEWQLGRTERTASELAALIRRYRAVLQLSDDSSTVQLEVEFAGRNGSSKLRAVFDITDNYPFAPLNVCLDTFGEKVDVECMRKLLIKNAKPGFGYLSRTCAVVEAYIES